MKIKLMSFVSVASPHTPCLQPPNSLDSNWFHAALCVSEEINSNALMMISATAQPATLWRPGKVHVTPSCVEEAVPSSSSCRMSGRKLWPADRLESTLQHIVQVKEGNTSRPGDTRNFEATRKQPHICSVKM